MTADDFPPGTRVRVIAYGGPTVLGHIGRTGVVLSHNGATGFPVVVQFKGGDVEDYLPSELVRVADDDTRTIGQDDMPAYLDSLQDAELADLAHGLHAEGEAATYQSLVSARDEAYGDQDRDERAWSL